MVDLHISATVSMSWRLMPSSSRSLQGIAIDYDKDPVSKRNRQYERQRQKDKQEEALLGTDAYQCSVCGETILWLEKGRSLQDMPVRGTDKSTVVNESSYLRRLNVCRGTPMPDRLRVNPQNKIAFGGSKDGFGMTKIQLGLGSLAICFCAGQDKAVQRPKGIERQFPLHCCNCDLPVAYRPVPLGTPTKFLYVLEDALTNSQKTPNMRLGAPVPKMGGVPSHMPSSVSTNGVESSNTATDAAATTTTESEVDGASADKQVSRTQTHDSLGVASTQLATDAQTITGKRSAPSASAPAAAVPLDSVTATASTTEVDPPTTVPRMGDETRARKMARTTE